MPNQPSRPEYPANKKYITVDESLKEWDNLNAYYQGEVFKLRNLLSPNKSGSKSKTSSCRKTSRKSSSRDSEALKPTLLELFGESPPPSEGSESDGSDAENTRKKSKRQRKGRESSNISNIESLPKKKSSKRKLAGKMEKLKLEITKKEEPEKEIVKNEEDETKLICPLVDFKVEYDQIDNTRIALDQLENSKMVGGIIFNQEEYRPPKALGLNVIHIKKVVDHKDEATPPTMTVNNSPVDELNSTFFNAGTPSNILSNPHRTPQNTTHGGPPNTLSNPHSTPDGAPSNNLSNPHWTPQNVTRRAHPNTLSNPHGPPQNTISNIQGTPQNTYSLPYGTPPTNLRPPHFNLPQEKPPKTPDLPHVRTGLETKRTGGLSRQHKEELIKVSLKADEMINRIIPLSPLRHESPLKSSTSHSRPKLPNQYSQDNFKRPFPPKDSPHIDHLKAKKTPKSYPPNLYNHKNTKEIAQRANNCQNTCADILGQIMQKLKENQKPSEKLARERLRKEQSNKLKANKITKYNEHLEDERIHAISDALGAEGISQRQQELIEVGMKALEMKNTTIPFSPLP